MIFLRLVLTVIGGKDKTKGRVKLVRFLAIVWIHKGN